MTSKKDRELFDELEAWSRKKSSLSINDFLREKEISLSTLERIASSNKKCMSIWGTAEYRVWENVKYALFTKSLPRSKIAQCIKESDTFQDKDPEEVMQSLENVKARLDLYLLAIRGDFNALMKCSLEQGMITQEQYEEAMAIPNK